MFWYIGNCVYIYNPISSSQNLKSSGPMQAYSCAKVYPYYFPLQASGSVLSVLTVDLISFCVKPQLSKCVCGTGSGSLGLHHHATL